MKLTRFFVLMLILTLWLPATGLALTTAQEYFNQASNQYLMGDMEGALANVEEALRLDPNFTAARQLRDTILEEMKEKRPAPAPAVSSPESSEKVSQKKMAENFFLSGEKLFRKEKLTEAKVYLDAAILLDPENNRARLLLEKIETKLKEQRVCREADIRNGFIFLSLGSLLLWVGLSFLGITLTRTVYKKILSKYGHRCFKCGAELLPNHEICPECGARVGLEKWENIKTEQIDWYKKKGWAANPFTLDVHPELFTGHQQEVKAILEKCRTQSGHIMITGPLGIGKTTLLRWLSIHLKKDFLTVYVSRPPRDFGAFVKFILRNIGIKVMESTEYDLYSIDAVLRKKGKNLFVLLDEMHEYNVEIERPLRTMGDLDNVALIMAGLPETEEKLKNEFLPLYERVVLHINLTSLEFNEMEELIRTRIKSVGGEGLGPFTTPALEKVYEITRGVPRSVFKMCDRLVQEAITKNEDKIEAALVEEVSRTAV